MQIQNSNGSIWRKWDLNVYAPSSCFNNQFLGSSEEEKEYKAKRKQIQEKLIKFATRIPIFMYLTDYRERCLKDDYTIGAGTLQKVTGLTMKDFELLVSLDLFNSALMNDAIYKFKRYEDPSLNYTGINT